MTWEKIITIEPELEQLRMSAERHKPSNSHFWQVWEDYKQQMSQLVGWKAKKIELVSQYDFVYTILFTALSGKK